MEISTTIISLIIALVSVIFAIISFARNKGKDNTEIQTRLTKIETDIVYIRQNLDKRESWENSIEERIRKLERGE